jgi:hypothetical protein
MLTTLKARGGLGPELEVRLEQIKWSLLELIELQIMYRDEVREIVPIFSLQLRDAYEAISDAGTSIDHRKRPDLDEMAQEAHQLLRSLDEPPQRRHHHTTPSSSSTS